MNWSCRRIDRYICNMLRATPGCCLNAMIIAPVIITLLQERQQLLNQAKTKSIEQLKVKAFQAEDEHKEEVNRLKLELRKQADRLKEGPLLGTWCFFPYVHGGIVYTGHKLIITPFCSLHTETKRLLCPATRAQQSRRAKPSARREEPQPREAAGEYFPRVPTAKAAYARRSGGEAIGSPRSITKAGSPARGAERVRSPLRRQSHAACPSQQATPGAVRHDHQTGQRSPTASHVTGATQSSGAGPVYKLPLS